MRRRGRACTTWRCCGSSAAPRTPSETAVLAGGDDVAFNAAMAPMLMAQPGEAHALLRAPPGRGPAGASPRRPGGSGADRSGHGAAQPVATLRGRGPPGGPARAGRLGVRRAGPRLRALGRQGSPGRSGGRGGAGGGPGRVGGPGRRAVGTAGRMAGGRRGAGPPAGPRLRPGGRRCRRRRRASAGWPRSATIRARRCSMPSRHRW